MRVTLRKSVPGRCHKPVQRPPGEKYLRNGKELGGHGVSKGRVDKVREVRWDRFCRALEPLRGLGSLAGGRI